MVGKKQNRKITLPADAMINLPHYLKKEITHPSIFPLHIFLPSTTFQPSNRAFTLPRHFMHNRHFQKRRTTVPTHSYRIPAAGIIAMLCLFVFDPNQAAAKDPIKGIIDSFAYGYEVKVSINGTPIPIIRGKGQQASRLFSADHPMKKQASPEQQYIFILREGNNTISVEFRKLEDAQTPLEVKLEIPDRYSKPLFHLRSSAKKSAKIDRSFRIEKNMPPSFKTVEVNDKNL